MRKEEGIFDPATTMTIQLSTSVSNICTTCSEIRCSCVNNLKFATGKWSHLFYFNFSCVYCIKTLKPEVPFMILGAKRHPW
jgi:hypothetical protein